MKHRLLKGSMVYRIKMSQTLYKSITNIGISKPVRDV